MFRVNLFAALVFPLFLFSLNAGSRELQDPARTGPLTRPCNPAADELRGKKKPRKKDLSPIAPGAACLDLRESSLAVQETLQKFVREQRWNIGEESVTEDTWTFSRYLKREELSDFVRPWTGKTIEWRAAKVLINVRTTELPGGYARTVVTARYEGYGEPEDQFAPKRESWTLQSNGAMESSLLAVVSRQLEKSH
jgi:hypothetical protein